MSENNDAIKKEQERLLHNSLIYMKIYDSLIERAVPRGLEKEKRDGSMEIHHIVPKCLGGTNDKFNLVLLTNREHVIAHMLLQRMYPDNLSLANAVNICFGQHTDKISSKTVAMFRENYNKLLSISRLGIEFSEETKQKIRESRLGTKMSEEAKQKISGKRNPGATEVIDHRTDPPTIYETKKSFLIAFGISDFILEKLLEDPNSGITGTPRKLKRRGYKIKDSNGIIYKSLRECARAYNRDRTTIQNYIENYPEKGFSYITQEEYMNYINDQVQNS